VTRSGSALAAAALGVTAAAGCTLVGDSLELTDAQQVIADMKLGPSELRVVGGVDHANRAYRVGEPIALTLQVNKDAKAAVLRVLSNGTTTLLFPSKEHPAAEVAANTVVSVPGISADTPGTVLFEFIAAGSGDAFLFDRKRAEEGTHAQLGATTRSLAKDIVMSIKPGPGREAAGAHLAVRVEAP
jgi:Domain of unknown function (DUF4384)